MQEPAGTQCLEPAYVTIAGTYARRIRSGELTPGTLLPSYAEIVQRTRRVGYRRSQGHRAAAKPGSGSACPATRRLVADHPNLVRVSPERQTESPEVTFRNESGREIHIDRETDHIPATEELADAFGLSTGDKISHLVTRAAEDHQPISISDTYQPLDVADASGATNLEETVADRLPAPTHADWLTHAPW